MEVIKIIFLITITMALSITLTMKTMSGPTEEEEKHPFSFYSSSTIHKRSQEHDDHMLLQPSKRVSRFLAANDRETNPRAADHCRKDNERCVQAGGTNSTCCNNKCMDLMFDNHNCGACKNKCKYTHTCCRGQCVDLAFDKRHCGQCNNRCEPGQYCIYGLCDYA